MVTCFSTRALSMYETSRLLHSFRSQLLVEMG